MYVYFVEVRVVGIDALIFYIHISRRSTIGTFSDRTSTVESVIYDPFGRVAQANSKSPSEQDMDTKITFHEIKSKQKTKQNGHQGNQPHQAI